LVEYSYEWHVRQRVRVKPGKLGTASIMGHSLAARVEAGVSSKVFAEIANRHVFITIASLNNRLQER